MSTVRRLFITLVLVSVLIGSGILARASSSVARVYVYLDETFGTGGKVTTQIDGSDTNYVNAVVQQPDGKIVLAGYNKSDDAWYNFALARYNPDGSVDTSFGSSGVVSTDFMGDDDRVYDLALQEDGNLVAAGCAHEAHLKMALVRYKPNGNLDKTWGGTNPLDGDGKVTTDVNYGYSSCANAVAIQPDGKIVVAGYTGSENGSELAVVRYNEDSSLDMTFNGTGKFTSIIDGSAKVIVIQPDGKMVVMGEYDPVLVRLNPDGSLDDTFGDQGVFTLTRWLYPRGLAIQPDGKLVVIGPCYMRVCIERINSDGSMDKTFGDEGYTLTKIGLDPAYDQPYALLIQPDNKILVAGGAAIDWGVQGVYDDPTYAFFVARFNNDGSLDTDFNGDGFKTLQFYQDPESKENFADGVAIQADGRLVVGGTVEAAGSFGSSIYRFAMARFSSQHFELNLVTDDPLPVPGQRITYTLTLSNEGPQALTNIRIADELPSEMTLTGPVQLDPPEAGVSGSPPDLVTGGTLQVGQSLTLTLPVSVNLELTEVTSITNTVTMTSTEIPKPFTASAATQTNAAPVAYDDYAMMEKNTTDRIIVLGNDSDPNGQALSLMDIGTPQHGVAEIDGSTVLYTPETDFAGTDEFAYTVTDGVLSANASVTVDVLDKVWHVYLEFIPKSRRAK